MDYISAKDAAAKWDTNLRTVQLCCKSGRVNGARKYGVSWMIPSDAEKPVDRRLAVKPAKAEQPKYLSCALLSSVVPMPPGDPDAALFALADEGKRAQYAAELCYLRGDYNAVKSYYKSVPPTQNTYLCAANIAACAAMASRDYPLYKEISSSVKALAGDNAPPETRKAASLLEALTAVCVNAPALAPQWLIDGEFADFSPDTRPMLIFMRVKYLQSVGEYSGMLAVAETARALFYREDGVTLVDIYLTCLCACASYALGRLEKTRELLDISVKSCETLGFVSPLAEYATCVGGLLNAALKNSQPAFEKAVITHVEDTLKNWLFFHNEFAMDNASLLLSAKEYQLAVLLKEGKTYSQAAGQLGISVGRTKNLISIIYEKLGISKKADIGQLVY